MTQHDSKRLSGLPQEEARAMQEAAAFRPVGDDDLKKVVGNLHNKQELQHLVADAYTPYDQVDPVFISALLQDDLDAFLQKFGVSEEEFLDDYRLVRGLTTTSRELRLAFRKKYGFDPFAVVYRENEFTLTEADIQDYKVKLLTPQADRSLVANEYMWWENQLGDMMQTGFKVADYQELKRWIENPKHMQAALLHLFTVLSIIYRVSLYTGRIDGAAIQRFLYPRYLPTWHELVEAFRLDIPEPQNWKYTTHEDGVNLARRLDDYNRDFNGIYANISFATFVPHFYDTHVSSHPLKFFSKATANLLLPNKEYIDSLAEYLVSRAAAYKAETVPILEVGAGTGRLSYFLNETEAFKEAGLKCIATDLHPGMSPMMVQYPRSQRAQVAPFECETLAQDDALEKYDAAIILCQMIPAGADWPAEWRKNKCVLEYVLIGPTDSHLCGKLWHTWGVGGNESVRTDFVPTFISDGFKRVSVDSVSRYIIGQDEHPQCYHQNRCVSFRRMTAIESFLRANVIYRGRPLAFVGFFTFLAYLSLPDE